MSRRFLISRLSKLTDTKAIYRRKVKIIISKKPGLTRAAVRKEARKAYMWLAHNDINWLDQTIPVDQPTTRDQHRKKMLETLANNVGTSRKKLRSLDETNYRWLLQNDYEWLQPLLPDKLRYYKNISPMDRRESYRRLLQKYPNYSRTEITRLDPSNYAWLKKYDSEWINQHQPLRRFKGKLIRLSVEERRSQFLNIYESNPNASRIELRRLCGQNYNWLQKRDSVWFRQYQPVLKKRVNKISKELRRELFLELRNNNPSMNRSQLKSLDKTNYLWLLQNDSIWLDENAPISRSR